MQLKTLKLKKIKLNEFKKILSIKESFIIPKSLQKLLYGFSNIKHLKLNVKLKTKLTDLLFLPEDEDLDNKLDLSILFNLYKLNMDRYVLKNNIFFYLNKKKYYFSFLTSNYQYQLKNTSFKITNSLYLKFISLKLNPNILKLQKQNYETQLQIYYNTKSSKIKKYNANLDKLIFFYKKKLKLKLKTPSYNSKGIRKQYPFLLNKTTFKNSLLLIKFQMKNKTFLTNTFNLMYIYLKKHLNKISNRIKSSIHKKKISNIFKAFLINKYVLNIIKKMLFSTFFNYDSSRLNFFSNKYAVSTKIPLINSKSIFLLVNTFHPILLYFNNLNFIKPFQNIIYFINLVKESNLKNNILIYSLFLKIMNKSKYCFLNSTPLLNKIYLNINKIESLNLNQNDKIMFETNPLIQLTNKSLRKRIKFLLYEYEFNLKIKNSINEFIFLYQSYTHKLINKKNYTTRSNVFYISANYYLFKNKYKNINLNINELLSIKLLSRFFLFNKYAKFLNNHIKSNIVTQL